jgi:hypothetical protein
VRRERTAKSKEQRAKKKGVTLKKKNKNNNLKQVKKPLLRTYFAV